MVRYFSALWAAILTEGNKDSGGDSVIVEQSSNEGNKALMKLDEDGKSGEEKVTSRHGKGNEEEGTSDEVESMSDGEKGEDTDKETENICDSSSQHDKNHTDQENFVNHEPLTTLISSSQCSNKETGSDEDHSVYAISDRQWIINVTTGEYLGKLPDEKCINKPIVHGNKCCGWLGQRDFGLIHLYS
ncbi:hypothetical protein AMATHDRAFT_8084 [Amanita thiersii Skay4041]|uniref:Uncharacterized protein n=1 Tax=Amanita thiersii Skay4041 TaxID=703135 RepID=A0A2A9ND70_9AGAR|nr:hypothetical protein AMATHDRAFT_8084 [Amanita thiersii Skay4041]